MSSARRKSQEFDVSDMKCKQPDDEGFSEGYKTPKYFITLAKESPRESVWESDDATYDSFHGRETDICRDTSDTDTSGDETIAVLEYEVATDCSSETNLYSGESSSGTEHEVVIAALTTWIGDSSAENDFSILADTEASDGTATDPELKRADYWECVKCKNKQNNPLYRYCERCYQIRKNHFPPRPKRRKKRSKRKTKDHRRGGPRERHQSVKSPSTSDDDEVVDHVGAQKWTEMKTTRSHETETTTDGKSSVKGRKCHLSRTECVANSAGETPESGEDGGGSSKGEVTRSSGGEGAALGVNSSLGDRKRRSSRVSRDLLEDEEEEEDEDERAVMCKKARLDEDISGRGYENKVFKNVWSEHLLGHSEESGVQSCASSQELSPMSSLTTILSQPESQETLCEELELARAKTMAEGNPLDEPCMMCLKEPKNGVFVHSRFLHLCCCYKCAVKAWNKSQRCPICNSKVKNVLKLFVH